MKERYNGMNAYVEMTENMDSSMLASLGARRRRRFLLIFLALLSVVILAPWALTTPEVYSWLSENVPPVAYLLSPRRGAVEKNGIRMELVSAVVDGNELELEVTFEDLEYDRLREGIDRCSWSIGSLSCYSQRMESCTWDEEEQELRCVLRFTGTSDMEQYDWDRGVELCVIYLERDGERITDMPVDITLTDSSELAVEHHDYGGTLLEPIGANLLQLQEGRNIDGMTIIDGDLHVQIALVEEAAAGQCYLKLTDPDGEKVPLLRLYEFTDGARYLNYVFDLQDRDVSECTLTVSLDPVQRITGEWSTVVMPKMAE